MTQREALALAEGKLTEYGVDITTDGGELMVDCLTALLLDKRQISMNQLLEELGSDDPKEDRKTMRRELLDTMARKGRSLTGGVPWVRDVLRSLAGIDTYPSKDPAYRRSWEQRNPEKLRQYRQKADEKRKEERAARRRRANG